MSRHTADHLRVLSFSSLPSPHLSCRISTAGCPSCESLGNPTPQQQRPQTSRTKALSSPSPQPRSLAPLLAGAPDCCLTQLDSTFHDRRRLLPTEHDTQRTAVGQVARGQPGGPLFAPRVPRPLQPSRGCRHKHSGQGEKKEVGRLGEEELS